MSSDKFDSGCGWPAFSKTLSSEDESIEVIIADLSLHYFNNDTTKIIGYNIRKAYLNSVKWNIFM